MKIMLPTKPHDNSSYTATQQTLSIMRQNFKKSYDVIQEIFQGKANWSKLFVPYNFYNEFEDFIEINIVAKEDDIFNSWYLFVQSKLRYLHSSYLDQSPMQFLVYPHPKAIRKEKFKGFRYCKTYYFGLKLKEEYKDDRQIIDLRHGVFDFLKHTIKKPFLNKQFKNSSNIYIFHLSQTQLPEQCFKQKRKKIVDEQFATSEKQDLEPEMRKILKVEEETKAEEIPKEVENVYDEQEVDDFLS